MFGSFLRRFLSLFFCVFCFACSVCSERLRGERERVIKEKWDAVEGSDRLIKTKHVNTDRTAIDFSRRFTAASVFFFFC